MYCVAIISALDLRGSSAISALLEFQVIAHRHGRPAGFRFLRNKVFRALAVPSRSSWEFATARTKASHLLTSRPGKSGSVKRSFAPRKTRHVASAVRLF